MKIQLEDLSLSYGRVTALDGISATLDPGIHLLLGENGAGKTSLLHLISGLCFPTSGKCMIDGGPTRFRLPSVLSKVFYLEAGMALPALLTLPGAILAEIICPGYEEIMLSDDFWRMTGFNSVNMTIAASLICTAAQIAIGPYVIAFWALVFLFALYKASRAISRKQV